MGMSVIDLMDYLRLEGSYGQVHLPIANEGDAPPPRGESSDEGGNPTEEGGTSIEEEPMEEEDPNESEEEPMEEEDPKQEHIKGDEEPLEEKDPKARLRKWWSSLRGKT